jgi:chromosome condensin MukBEF ATPase and DNA-binding subunit MukB
VVEQMKRLVEFFLGLGLAFFLYKTFVEPTIEEQQKTIRELWNRTQDLEMRVRELEQDLSQNTDEHRILTDMVKQLERQSIPIDMRRKLEELLTTLDSIAERRNQKPKPEPEKFFAYI